VAPPKLLGSFPVVLFHRRIRFFRVACGDQFKCRHHEGQPEREATVENDSSRSTARNSAVRARFQKTYGEVLPDDTIVDLVADGNDLLLCHYDGTRTVILPYG